MTSKAFAFIKTLKNYRCKNPISQKSVIRFSQIHPRTYLIAILGLAIFCMVYILVIPILTIYFPYIVYQKIQLVQAAREWFDVLLYLSLFFTCVALSDALFRLRFVLPMGMALKEEKQPLLFSEIDKIRKHYKNVKIHRVIIDSQTGVRVIKTPRRFLPFFCINTLVIGLPTMQCTPPDYFRSYLVGAIGQLGGRHAFFLSKLYFLNDTLQQYLENYRTTRSISNTVCRYYLTVMVRLYTYFSVGIVKRYVLERDRYALDLSNDSDYLQAIGFEYLLNNYLRKNYWPQVEQMQRNYQNAAYDPYASMSRSVLEGLQQYDLKAVLDRLVRSGTPARITQPSFSERLVLIGMNKTEAPVVSPLNAAKTYLGPTYSLVVKLMDDLWHKSNQRETR